MLDFWSQFLYGLQGIEGVRPVMVKGAQLYRTNNLDSFMAFTFPSSGSVLHFPPSGFGCLDTNCHLLDVYMTLASFQLGKNAS